MSKVQTISPEVQMLILVELIQHQNQELAELKELVLDLATPSKKYLSVSKFAQSLGWSPSHVRNLCEEGKLKAIQPGGDGGTWKILTSELPRLRQQIKAGLEANHHSAHTTFRKTSKRQAA
ncbi:MAG: helix-turn-helix domain-containing protein [Patescibacteria group bacterium]